MSTNENLIEDWENRQERICDILYHIKIIKGHLNSKITNNHILFDIRQTDKIILSLLENRIKKI